MTKEEAIKIIDEGKNFAYDEKYVEAFNMAIKSLEQQDKILQILDDCELEAWEILEKIKKAVRK